jgi:hypothetical protein
MAQHRYGVRGLIEWPLFSGIYGLMALLAIPDSHISLAIVRSGQKKVGFALSLFKFPG